MHYAKPLLHAVLLASLTLPACTSATGEVEEQVGTAEQKALTLNALTLNALTLNALTLNALTLNALTLNALTLNGLKSAKGVGEALEDPDAREVFSYIVGCALPAHATVDVTNSTGSYSFPGSLGLAPEWGHSGGSCGVECQQWVSACVISRLDHLGEPVQISVRGENPALQTSASERAAYTSREATYYGDIFSTPQRLFACLSPGQTQDHRVCGPSIKGCGVDVLGSCADLCGFPRADGSFPDCVGPRAPDGQLWWGGDIYQGSITVFTKP